MNKYRNFKTKNYEEITTLLSGHGDRFIPYRTGNKAKKPNTCPGAEERTIENGAREYGSEKMKMGTRRDT